MNPDNKLRAAIQQFRSWADSCFPGERSGEWETEYENWEDLYLSAIAVLRTSIDEWSDDTKELLIYAIARDNEVELLSEQTTAEQLAVLASASLASQERDAKWQFAKQLGKYRLTAQSEELLLGFSADSDEYVRRRALMALGDVGSAHTEVLAVRAWQSGEEYQRMASLHALSRIGSPLLPKYLELAEADGREFLRGIAEQIRTGELSDHLCTLKRSGPEKFGNRLLGPTNLLNRLFSCATAEI